MNELSIMNRTEWTGKKFLRSENRSIDIETEYSAINLPEASNALNVMLICNIAIF